MNWLHSSFDYLTAQSFETLVVLFWFVIVFEIPRYVIPFAMASLTPRPRRPMRDFEGRVSAIVAGHSEAHKIEACVRALREQSRPPDEIVVISDGSVDGMDRKIAELQRLNLIDLGHATQLRSGKSAGANMAARMSTGQIIVNVDCDCSFDRHAFREILRPFADPQVGAVCGNLLPRNASHSLITAFQAIEYAISISLGKQAADRLDQVTCISGAFGAFRRDVYEAAGGVDSGSGEDLDLTLALRQSGWGIRFARDAVSFTDVPQTRAGLVAQRFRWERDAVRLRYRKHGHMMNPFSQNFRPAEFLHELEFLIFNVLAAIALPIYCAWLFVLFGSLGFVVLIAAQLGLMVLDTILFMLAASVTPKMRGFGLLPFVPGYSIYNGVYMRFVRLSAYVQEWVMRSSYKDPFVPTKVHQVRH